MNYEQLKAVIASMTEEQLQRPVIAHDIVNGHIFPVYGTVEFDDCGFDHSALRVCAGDGGDDNIHPIYTRGDVYSYLDDASVTKYDDAEAVLQATAIRAGWSSDDFIKFMDESEEHGDGLSFSQELNDKMDKTDPVLWSAMIAAYTDMKKISE